MPAKIQYAEDTLVQQTTAKDMEGREQYHSVVAEKRELEELLADLPEENVIERISLKARLQSARDIMARLRKLEETYAE